MMNEAVKKKTRTFQRRIILHKLIHGLSLAAWLGLIPSAAFLFASFFFPIAHAWLWAMGIWLSFMLISAVVLRLKSPRAQRMAKAMDACGLQERMQTMWALKDDASAFAKLQRQETEEALLRVDPKTMVALSPPKKHLYASAAALAFCILLCLLPNPQSAILDTRQQIKHEMQAQEEKISALKDVVNKEHALSEEERALLNERLDALAEELRSGKEYKEAIKKTSELQEAITQLNQKQAKKQLADLREALQQSDDKQVSTLAEHLDESRPESLEETLKSLMEETTEEQRQLAAEALEAAAESSAHSDTAEALEKMSEALENQDEAALQEALSDFQSAGSSQNSSLVSISDQVSMTKSKMSQLSAAYTGSPSSLKGSGQQGTTSGNGSDAAEQGNGQGSGSTNKGQGNGSGQGQGQGQGQGNGAGAGTGALVDPEKIYDDSRFGGNGSESHLSGHIKEDGAHAQAETDAGEGTLDGYIPYQQVVGDYRDEAVRASKRDQLPPAVQNWVERYFSSLID